MKQEAKSACAQATLSAYASLRISLLLCICYIQQGQISVRFREAFHCNSWKRQPLPNYYKPQPFVPIPHLHGFCRVRLFFQTSLRRLLLCVLEAPFGVMSVLNGVYMADLSVRNAINIPCAMSSIARILDWSCSKPSWQTVFCWVVYLIKVQSHAYTQQTPLFVTEWLWHPPNTQKLLRYIQGRNKVAFMPWFRFPTDAGNDSVSRQYVKSKAECQFPGSSDRLPWVTPYTGYIPKWCC